MSTDVCADNKYALITLSLLKHRPGDCYAILHKIYGGTGPGSLTFIDLRLFYDSLIIQSHFDGQ